MKRRIAQCVAGACVAGMVAAAPGVAFASETAADAAKPMTWNAAEETAIALYGPPSIFDPEWPIEVLYGPPSVFDRQENTMTVTTSTQVVKESRVAEKKKKLPNALEVRDAVGLVGFTKVKKGSSKQLAVNPTTGIVTVKKGTKAGVYRMKVLVSATGDLAYLPAETTAVVKVRVK